MPLQVAQFSPFGSLPVPRHTGQGEDFCSLTVIELYDALYTLFANLYQVFPSCFRKAPILSSPGIRENFEF